MWLSDRVPSTALPALLLALALQAGSAHGQSLRSGRLFAGPETGTPETWAPETLWSVVSPMVGAEQSVDGPSQGRAFLSSLVLPGLGQYQQGKRRWLLYAGVEVTAAALYLDRRSDGRTLRRRYRNLAWDVARESVSVGPRADGDFVYYETLSKWMRSGAWDADANAPDVQPEADPGTYNGSIWSLAVQIFDLDPESPEASPGYQNALAYYMERGYGPAFLWDWSGSPGSQEAFGDLIQESDGRFRAARQAVGILIANHLLSALDGLITARLTPGFRAGTELRVEVPVGR